MALAMNEPVKTFLSELRAVNLGDMVISNKFVRAINENITKFRGRIDNILSQREIEIINMVGNGNTNKEIGKELVISENGIKFLLNAIATKENSQEYSHCPAS